jgi:thioredoxin 1
MIGTDKIVYLTAENFEQTIKEQLTIVDFWAEWCTPCRMQMPILEEFSSEMEDKVLIAKLNVEDNRSIASKYGIRNIPTLLIFKHGKLEKQLIGLQSKQVLLDNMKNLI